jgi:CMP/dCMP kinase
VARALLDQGRALDDLHAAVAAARSLDLGRFDETRLRGREMGEAASVVSAFQEVRDALLDLQQRFAAQPDGAVLDGRDIGTIVCPAAEAKLFVTASAEERARRRMVELAERAEPADYAAILADIRRRDERDSTRSAAPLRQAADATLLDTTTLSPDAAFAEALAIVEGIRGRR